MFGLNLFGGTPKTDATNSAAPASNEAAPEIEAEQLQKLLSKATSAASAPATGTDLKQLNANPGTPTNPAKTEVPELKLIQEVDLDKLGPEVKAIYEKCIAPDKATNQAFMGSDGRIYALRTGPSTPEFKRTWTTWLLKPFGYGKNYAPDWIRDQKETAAKGADTFAFEDPTDIKTLLENGTYESLSVFTKGPDGKYADAAAVIPLTNSLKIPETIQKNKEFAPVVTAIETDGSLKGTFILDQTVINPTSEFAGKPEDAAKLLPSFAEAFFKAKPEAKVLVIPRGLGDQKHFISSNLSYDTLNFKQPCLTDEKDKFTTLKGPVTFIRRNGSPRALPAGLADLVAWSQMTNGGRFPEELNEDNMKLAKSEVPVENKQAIENFNREVNSAVQQALPAPVTVPSPAPVAAA